MFLWPKSRQQRLKRGSSTLPTFPAVEPLDTHHILRLPAPRARTSARVIGVITLDNVGNVGKPLSRFCGRRLRQEKPRSCSSTLPTFPTVRLLDPHRIMRLP